MKSEAETNRINRRLPLSDQVYTRLRQSILTGEIKPGELIDEKGIAAQLEISRTPVREAIKRLSDELLVHVVAQSATRASQLQLDTIREAYLIRRALEMESAWQAAPLMNQEHADELAAIIDTHLRAIRRKKYSDAIEIDDEFHRYIAMISNLGRLWRTVEVSKAQLDRCRHILLPVVGQAEKTIEQHREILRALNSKRSDKAREAMQSHLDFAFRSAYGLLEKTELEFPVEPKAGGRLKSKSASD